jgi:hypothetical protein
MTRSSTVRVVVLLLLLANSACAAYGPPLPGVDSYKLHANLRIGHATKADVRRLLGDPPLGGEFKGMTTEEISASRDWCYPQRAGSSVRAPKLKVWLDTAGVLLDWGFYHPVTDMKLEVRETLQDAYARQPRKRAGSTIEFSWVLQPGGTEREIWLAMTLGSAAKYRIESAASGRLLTFYVDHPSPLYMPVFSTCIKFDQAGVVHFKYGTGYGSRFAP